MAWDTPKVAHVDIVAAADWNNMVVDQKDHNTRHEVSGTDAVRSVCTVGTTAPATPIAGQLWLDTN